MSLLDELREIAPQLVESQLPTPVEERGIVAALIYYLDTRLNLASPPENTALLSEEQRRLRFHQAQGVREL